VPTTDGILKFYLEECENSCDADLSGLRNFFGDTMYTADLRSIVFYGGRSPYFEDLEPNLILDTTVPELVDNLDFKLAFRVRNLYTLNLSHIALEIDDGLVIVDLLSGDMRFTNDTEELKEVLSNAEILSTPIDNHHYMFHPAYCDEEDGFNSSALSLEPGEFVFCLE